MQYNIYETIRGIEILHKCILAKQSYLRKELSQNVSFFQMKLVSFGLDHPPTPSKWKCEKQNTDVL